MKNLNGSRCQQSQYVTDHHQLQAKTVAGLKMSNNDSKGAMGVQFACFGPSDDEINVYDLESVECCFTSTETVSLLGTRGQEGHLDFHKAPEL